jgi:predicted DCC family thiol-disulfide oxidoreductase YuxK
MNHSDIWFVYDGDCPICSAAANALEIRKSVGQLYLVDARVETSHPLIQEIKDRQLDLDEGMVLKYAGNYYHGRDALHMMALLGSSRGWFNRANALLFRSRLVARICYPVMRAVRNTLLRLKGVRRIRNLSIDPGKPIFRAVFGRYWDSLPPVMQTHYGIRPYGNDVVEVEGTLDFVISPLISAIARVTGMSLLANSGKNVPSTVVFRSAGRSQAFCFDRTFRFPDKGVVRFCSRMEWAKDNELIEFMRHGFGWKVAYVWDGTKVILQHRGYVWRIFGISIPIPLSLILGKIYAEERPLSSERFSMRVHAINRFMGQTFSYAGEFKVIKVSCSPS